MKRIALYILTALLLGTAMVPGTVAAAEPTRAVKACPGDSVLLFPPWFQGLKCDVVTAADGSIVSQTVHLENINQVWIIVMNIVQWLIIAGGYVSLYFIIWSGFKYITAAGDPQKVTSAKNTLMNAVIGLVIVLASVAIVRTIQAGVLRGVAI